MMLCSTLAKAVFACKGKCGKTWTPLNFFRTLAFLNCFCSSVCLEGVQKFEKLDNDQLTTSGRHKCGSTSFPGLSIQMEKKRKNADSEKRRVFLYFWIANGNFPQVGGVSSKYQFCLCSISMKGFAALIWNMSEKRKSTKMQWDLCDDRDFQREGMNEPWAQKNTILYFRKKLFAKIIEVKVVEFKQFCNVCFVYKKSLICL